MMAYTQTLACFFFLMIGATMAAEYTVGDAAGWTTGLNYSQWANKYKFRQGDTLVFKWQGKGPYRVVAVTKKELDTCKLDRVNKVTFPLVTEYRFQIPKSGYYFFINDLPIDACARGMRLQIRAEEAHVAPAKKESPRPVDRSHKKGKKSRSKKYRYRSDAASTATLSLSTTLTITFCLALFLASKV